MAPEAIAQTDVVERQTAAYNLRDIDAYCACFAPDAVIMNLDGSKLAHGHGEIRARYAKRFCENPELNCQVTGRLALGNVVVDRERVTGFEGETIQVIAIYEVVDGLIGSIRIIWS